MFQGTNHAPRSESPNAASTYRTRHTERSAALAEASKKTDALGNYRLALALIALVLILLPLFVRHGSPWWGLGPLFIGFIVLGKLQDRAFDLRRRLAGAVRFYREGLDRQEERWRELPDSGVEFAEQYRNRVHFVDDLDLFGPASLFQLINRATTALGRRTLARYLVSREPVEEILRRQAAVLELAPKLDFREELYISSAQQEPDILDDEQLLAWAERAEPIPMANVLRVLGIVQPIVLISAATFVLFGGHQAFLAVAVVLHLITLVATRNISAERAGILSGPDRVLSRYAAMIAAVEAAPFQAPILVDLKRRLEKGGEKASTRIRSLHRLVDLLDARLNMFFALAIGPALLWNLNLVLRAEDWRRRAGPQLRGWLEVLAEFEALASFAAVGFERPDYSMPQFASGSASFVASGLAHPLIDRATVVANDLSLGGPGSVLLLSGSNMSGKSTLLRAVGINVVLAQAGAPVAARHLALTPTILMTSVRIVDSLAKGASHFYAEIQRIKMIVDAARTPTEPVLYLLDEMLHGTNSRERYIGAVAVIRWLSKNGAMGIVTTHDLALAHIEDELGSERVTNRHFSDEVHEDRIRFDYKLRSGPVVSTNALRLMRSIGMDLEFESVRPAIDAESLPAHSR